MVLGGGGEFLELFFVVVVRLDGGERFCVAVDEPAGREVERVVALVSLRPVRRSVAPSSDGADSASSSAAKSTRRKVDRAPPLIAESLAPTCETPASNESAQDREGGVTRGQRRPQPSTPSAAHFRRTF